MTVEVRLLSHNVRSLRGDRDAVARGIRAGRPDVVALQEAPRFLRWRGRRAALARDTGLVVVGGPRLGGVALLGALRTRVLVTRDAMLSRTPGLHRRGVAMAVLEVAGVRVALAAVHLGRAGAAAARGRGAGAGDPSGPPVRRPDRAQRRRQRGARGGGVGGAHRAVAGRVRRRPGRAPEPPSGRSRGGGLTRCSSTPASRSSRSACRTRPRSRWPATTGRCSPYSASRRPLPGEARRRAVVTGETSAGG